ncbi:BrnT family toxin [Sphingomonas sp. ID0503]|uniref:BrnT family toxin n=1 Tax=Sphingomonas sp. ID0503 TaxID=3399691 RepID=UPI003AFB3016
MFNYFKYAQITIDDVIIRAYNKPMDITFDPDKNAANIENRGLSFEDFAGFDGVPSVVVDDRYDYGETRYQARGRINGKGFCIVYTLTATGIRLISFRRAHEKEMRRYE